MKKSEDRNQNCNVSITDNKILDCFKIYDTYKNKLTVVPMLALLVSLATIFLNKNEIKTTYFWLSLLLILCLTVYLVTITIAFHTKIKENKLEYKNNLRKNNSNKDEKRNRVKNNLIEKVELIELSIKDIDSKVSKYNTIKGQLINYANKRKKEDILNSKEKKLLINIYNTLKEKLEKLRKNKKTNEKKDNKEITILRRVLETISKIIKSLTPKIKGGLEGVGGAEIGTSSNALGTDASGGQSQSTSSRTSEEVPANPTIDSTAKDAVTKADQGEIQKPEHITEPAPIPNNTPQPLPQSQPIDHNKIEEEIRNNIMKSLEEAGKEMVTFNKNEKDTIEQLSSSISSAITESLVENYNLTAKTQEEDKSLIQEGSGVTPTEEEIPIPAEPTAKPPEQQTEVIQEEKIDLDSMFDMDSLEESEFVLETDTIIEQKTLQAAENKAKDATPAEDIKSANEDLSRQNQIMAKRKNGAQVWKR